MFSLNRVQIIGYLTQPVELRQTPSGQSVAELNIAVPYTFETEGGQTLSGQSFHAVTAWGGMASVAAQYLKAGGQVFVSGRLQTDTWEDQQSGEKRSKTRLTAMDLILLDPKGGQHEAGSFPADLRTCLNRTDVIGNLTRDPELRTTTNGKSVVTLGIATNERWKDKTTNEDRERVEFHNIVVWGTLAQHSAEHLKKGMRVHATGRVQTRTWETKQGSKRQTTEIVAESLSLLGVRNPDVAVTTATRAERMAARGASSPPSPEEREKSTVDESETPVPVAEGADVPAISYEHQVKVEDLPF